MKIYDKSLFAFRLILPLLTIFYLKYLWIFTDSLIGFQGHGPNCFCHIPIFLVGVGLTIAGYFGIRHIISHKIVQKYTKSYIKWLTCEDKADKFINNV
jgi:hypothetical protein